MHGKVLLLSQRRISDLVAFCLAYEFEDTLQAVTGAERIDATDLPSSNSPAAPTSWRACFRIAAAGSRLAPSPRSKVALSSEYELFFPIFSNAFELYSLATIPDWRQRCRKAACFITEVWTDQLPEYLLELLSEFDHIFTGLQHCVEDVARITGRPCSYLPLATDVLRFAPAPARPAAADRGLQYRPPLADHASCIAGGRGAAGKLLLLRHGGRERHRPEAAHVPRRQCAGASPDAGDHPQAQPLLHRQPQSRQQSRIHGRSRRDLRPLLRRMAAGTVMIGEAPRTEEFERQFDWPDAVIHLPFDSPDVEQHPDGPEQRPAAVGDGPRQECQGGRPPARLAPPHQDRVRSARPRADRKDAAARRAARPDSRLGRRYQHSPAPGARHVCEFCVRPRAVPPRCPYG